MRLYRFSPIASEAELYKVVEYLHRTCHELCFDVFGKYLPVAGNVGIFSHYENEFTDLSKLRNALTAEVPNYNNKYFKLLKPITISGQGDTPGATYEFLYVRNPDPYRSQVGDIDFILDPTEHELFKRELTTNEFRNKARIFSRPEENMIELFDADKDVLSYVVTSPMSEKAR